MSMMLALHLAKPNAKLYVIANVIFSVNCFSPTLRGRCKVGPHVESVGRVFLAENSYLARLLHKAQQRDLITHGCKYHYISKSCIE